LFQGSGKIEQSFRLVGKMNEFDMVDKLVLDGALEFCGVDKDTGESLYKPTDKLKDIDSQLSDDLSVYFSAVTMKLWEKGFLDMDIMLEDPLVKLAPKSFDKDALKTLDKNERMIMQEIIRVLLEKK
jgi:hypothetical protein